MTTSINNQILIDLQVIKQLGENDKLAVILEPGITKLYVDSYSYFSTLTRKYFGYNRNNTIQYLEKLTGDIKNYYTFLVDGLHTELINNLINALKEAIKGLQNLKITYIKDSIITAKLTLIIGEFNNYKSQLERVNTNVCENINLLSPDEDLSSIMNNGNGIDNRENQKNLNK